MIRRLDRYLIKEMFVPLITGTIIIAILFAANELIAIFKQLNVQAIPPIAIAQMVLFRMPQWLVLTLPVGMAIGAALAIGRLARESEITAMRAAGIPIRRLLMPVAFIGLALSVANFLLVERVVPVATKKYRELASGLLPIAFQPTFRSGTTFNLGRYTVRFGAMQRNTDGSLDLTDVFLFEIFGPSEITIYQAEKGVYRDGVWTFPKAYVRSVRGVTTQQFRTEDVVINERIKIADIFRDPVPEEQTAQELAVSIREARERGAVPLKMLVDYQVKFSVPASCLIFALTSAIAAVRMARAGPFVGLLVSLVLVALYFNVHVICTDIVGKGGWVDPVVAAWMPNGIYALLALLGFWRLE